MTWSRRRPGGFLWFCIIMLFGAGGIILPAQGQPAREADGVITSQLYKISGGYIGIARYGTVGVLTRYNDTLLDLVTLPYQGLGPVDIIIPPSASQQPYLLGTYEGKGVLYRIALGPRPEIVPVWESEFPPYEKFIAADDMNGDGVMEMAMLGRSAFSVVGADGTERYTIRGDMLGALFHDADSARFLLAMRSGESIRITQIDARTGTALAVQEIPDAHELMMKILPTAAGDALVVAALGREPAAYVFDPDNLYPPDRYPLPLSPLALVSYGNGEGLAPAAIFGGYPGPTLLQLLPDAPLTRIDYPLVSVPLGGTTSGRFNTILTRDSLVLYDRMMRPYAVLPSVGTADVRVMPLDSARLLVASEAGSRVVEIPASGITWLERNWLLVAVAAMGAIIIAALLIASRRYRFVRNIYNNLVRVPGSYGVIVMTPRQRVQQINQSARALLEIASYIPHGRHISEYLVTEDVRPVLAGLRRLFSEGEGFEQHVNVERNGSIHALTFRGRPLLGLYGRTTGYLLLVEDVTQTLERERLINWASVAHHIAHEMKTPLSTVRMTAEMLHDRLSSNGVEGEHVRATSRIIRQSGRLREIVEDLLTIARTEAMQKINTDMQLLLSSLVHDFSDNLSGSIELRYEVIGEDFRCHADVAQLTVALRNLLDNAAQAIGAREGGLIHLQLRDEDTMLGITVEDNGIGMSRDTLANIFKPFYTERQGGSGIGTVIIRRVIEGHGGTIHVESEQGKGTRFVIHLPRV